MELGVRNLLRDMDEFIFNDGVVRHDHGDKGVFFHFQQVIAFDGDPLRGGGHGKYRIVAELG